MARFRVQSRRQFSVEVKFVKEVKTVLESQVHESSSGWGQFEKVKLKSQSVRQSEKQIRDSHQSLTDQGQVT